MYHSPRNRLNAVIGRGRQVILSEIRNDFYFRATLGVKEVLQSSKNSI